MERTLSNTLPLGRKMELFTTYLQNGGEIEVDGRTYVWLDNFVTKEVEQADGTTDYFGLDGLAIKTTRFNTETMETKPWYMGASDMSLGLFIDLLTNVSEIDWLGITASSALKSMIPNRD